MIFWTQKIADSSGFLVLAEQKARADTRPTRWELIRRGCLKGTANMCMSVVRTFGTGRGVN